MSERPYIHRCDIRGSGRIRYRILTARERVRPLLCDVDLLVLQQVGDAPVSEIARTTIRDFPRGMGIDGLFGSILSRLACAADAVDESGAVVSMPTLTPDEWRERAEGFREMARDADERAGGKAAADGDADRKTGAA